MIKRIFFTLIFAGLFCVGCFFVYRALMPLSRMMILNTKVLNKRITYFSGTKGPRRYCLAFKVEGQNDEIAVNLGRKEQADSDTLYKLIGNRQPVYLLH